MTILQGTPVASPKEWTHKPDPQDSSAAIYSFAHGFIAASVKITKGSDIAVATLCVGERTILDKQQLPVREAFVLIHQQVSALKREFALVLEVPLPLVPTVGTHNIKVYLDPSDDLTEWMLTFVDPTIAFNPQRHFPHWSYCVLDRYTVRHQDGAKMRRVD